MNKRTLIVDDNQLTGRLVSVFLKRLGWQPQLVDSGQEALAVLAREHVDMVLLDLRMPGMPGELVCRCIRDELGLRALPVVAFTAHSMPEEKARIIAAGFDDVLIKPISFDDVRRLCESVADAPGGQGAAEAPRAVA
ncbi:response regulator [Azohydromonas aeria]|uniref:response regulator n=1 Tax=Azohydromonas aeria TaxID=2590212 RepID=UPI0012FAD897|nr:response regulator [Azohydromonas aeria]